LAFGLGASARAPRGNRLALGLAFGLGTGARPARGARLALGLALRLRHGARLAFGLALALRNSLLLGLALLLRLRRPQHGAAAIREAAAARKHLVDVLGIAFFAIDLVVVG